MKTLTLPSLTSLASLGPPFPADQRPRSAFLYRHFYILVSFSLDTLCPLPWALLAGCRGQSITRQTTGMHELPKKQRVGTLPGTLPAQPLSGRGASGRSLSFSSRGRSDGTLPHGITVGNEY